MSYAWDARGDGLADTVSGSGWKLFAERLAKAKTILYEASASAQKCPDWYLAMQLVARGQSYGPPKATALFQQAVAFEPAYQYYCRTYATYLLRSGVVKKAMPRVLPKNLPIEWAEKPEALSIT